MAPGWPLAHRRGGPSYDTVVKFFGSWPAAVEAAGLADRAASTRPRTQTHCKRGHELTPENTYTYPDGERRECLVCRRLRDREKRAKRGAVARPGARKAT